MKSTVFAYNLLADSFPSVSTDTWKHLDDFVLNKAVSYPYILKMKDNSELSTHIQNIPDSAHEFLLNYLKLSMTSEMRTVRGLNHPSSKKQWIKELLCSYEELNKLFIDTAYTKSITQDLFAILSFSKDDPTVFNEILLWVHTQENLKSYFFNFLSSKIGIRHTSSQGLLIRTPIYWKNLEEIESFLSPFKMWDLEEQVPPVVSDLGDLYQSVKLVYKRVGETLSFFPQPWMSQRLWDQILPHLHPRQGIVPSLFSTIRASKTQINSFLKNYPEFGSGLFHRSQDFSLDQLYEGSELSFFKLKYIEHAKIESTLKWSENNIDKMHWLVFNTVGGLEYRIQVVKQIINLLKKEPRDSFNYDQLIKFGCVLRPHNKTLLSLLDKFLKETDNEFHKRLIVRILNKDLDLKTFVECIPDSLLIPILDYIFSIKKVYQRRNPDKYSDLISALRGKALQSKNKQIRLKAALGFN